MADLTDDIRQTVRERYAVAGRAAPERALKPGSCCDAEAQAGCCEPADKAGCCGSDRPAGSCGCDAQSE
jgi:hypothetical protein